MIATITFGDIVFLCGVSVMFGFIVGAIFTWRWFKK